MMCLIEDYNVNDYNRPAGGAAESGAVILIFTISNPKNWAATLVKAKATAKTAKPIKALIILLLAFPTASLSPPEVIHSNAPQISIASTTKRATAKAIVKVLVIKFDRVANPLPAGGVMAMF